MNPTPPAHPLRGPDDLLAPFHAAEKPRAEHRIGTEAEKFGVLLPSGAPLPFEGRPGIRAVFEGLVARHGWSEEREVDQGPVIALRRGAASITLEPGAQLELSGAPLATIHETEAEFRAHVDELEDVSRDLGIRWLGLGFHPFARRDELPWVPKLRYPIMREYLPARGETAHDMMLRTCTVQANLDYLDEDDAMRKLRVALRLQPIVTAMFANSPFREGMDSGARCLRAGVWIGMDPDRSGLLPFAWGRSARYRDYVEWALDAPMFLIKREHGITKNTGQTFRAFLKDGYEGLRAEHRDWEVHLNTLFPEVRLKRTIEVRGADAQTHALTPALPALWKGLLYDEAALREAERLSERYEYDDVSRLRPEIVQHALRATLRGRELSLWANEVFDIAWSGLARQAVKNEAGEDETLYLRPLETLVRRGATPADVLVEAAKGGDLRATVLELGKLG